MKLTIKNNNIYYYNYPIINGDLSCILIPLSFILIFYYNKYVKFFSYVMLLIFIAGTYDSYLRSIKYKLNTILLLGLIFHIIGLYPLTNIKKYMKPNIINYLTSILGIFIIFVNG